MQLPTPLPTPEEIKEKLKKRGYSQVLIAEDCNVSKSVVSRVIDGKATSHRIRCAIAAAMGCEVGEVFQVQQNPTKPGPRRRRAPKKLG